MKRRDFLKTGIGMSSLVLFPKEIINPRDGSAGKRVVISSRNGMKAAEKAMTLLKEEKDPLDAVISGVNLVEQDPEDTSVGFGGLPNEQGVVELDASVMHGSSHNGGAVASLRGIKTPSQVAKKVMERTGHALLVGRGALQFAKAHGFSEENLLTAKARERWLKRKEELSDRDYWYPPKSKKLEPEIRKFVEHHGTINCCALDGKGDLAGVTTTSGHFFKIPGRVGDSPIIGAGLYVDNDVGAAGSTGFGEANILTCGSFQVVEQMRAGHDPEEACIRALKNILQKVKSWTEMVNDRGIFIENLTFYAVNKKGEYGSATIWSGKQYVINEGLESRLKDCAFLYDQNIK